MTVRMYSASRLRSSANSACTLDTNILKLICRYYIKTYLIAFDQFTLLSSISTHCVGTTQNIHGNQLVITHEDA